MRTPRRQVKLGRTSLSICGDTRTIVRKKARSFPPSPALPAPSPFKILLDLFRGERATTRSKTTTTAVCTNAIWKQERHGFVPADNPTEVRFARRRLGGRWHEDLVEVLLAGEPASRAFF